MGKQEFLSGEKVVYLPWRFHCKIFQNLNVILASRRHTRGNSDIEILKSLEDPEKLFKKKDKEKIDFSLFGASSSRDSPSIFYQEWEVHVGRGLLKSKSESNIKNTEFNSCILESYLLDSLWRDLQ